MKIEQVAKLSPLDRFLYWVEERTGIYVKKNKGKPKPWTDDEILQAYRFCNVRRMNDKVSEWLFNIWFRPYFDHPNMLPAVALARFVNLPSSLTLLTSVVFAGKPADRAASWNGGLIAKLLREHRDAGNTVFNGAYVVRGNDGQDKIESVVDYYVQPLVDDPPEIDTSSMRKTHAALQECYGFGSFMAGQVVADLRHAIAGTWEDAKKWAPIGPGSRRGMNRLQSRDVKYPLRQLEFEEELLALMAVARQKLPRGVTKELEAMDWQNCLCEYDKYSRVIAEEGRPKQLYAGKA